MPKIDRISLENCRELNLYICAKIHLLLNCIEMPLKLYRNVLFMNHNFHSKHDFYSLLCLIKFANFFHYSQQKKIG